VDQELTSHALSRLVGSWRMHLKIRLRQSMRIYLKNNPAELCPDLMWNDAALGFLDAVAPNKKQTKKNSQMSSNME